MISLMGMRDQLAQTSATLERLDDVFRTTTEEEEDKKKKNLNESIEEIEFKDVVFQYGLRRPTLKKINFKVEKGESIGIIGESGCGKTTLIKLIMGFYDANEGEILINGKSLDNFTKNSIRKRMAYVSQNDYWFQDTIYNNLTIGKEKATKEELDKVCKMVKMEEYIENSPYGYNSMIEEGAVNLSSGQKQRFSIAKALITNPDVLILDESTANLDASTEEYVVEQLKGEKEKIKIIVAHRLNTLIHCNKIIAMKDGIIAEAGTPKELLKKDGMFKELWSIQNRVFDNMQIPKD
jgi:ATP-binding cassette subfamily B protein